MREAVVQQAELMEVKDPTQHRLGMVGYQAASRLGPAYFPRP